MDRIIFNTLAVMLAVLAFGEARGNPQADIVVMTQNQYLGADLSPIVEADSDLAVNLAMIDALIEVANNNYPARVEALAESIADRQPHLVALQEMFSFRCIDIFGTGNCALFEGAFNDHLAMTVEALDGQYAVAAQVRNLTLPPPGLGIPGIPVITDGTGVPIFIEVIDRDVILARADIETQPVVFPCLLPSADGCNFENAAPVDVGGIPVRIERGFVGVDTTVNGADYRFINTHLEVKQLGNSVESLFLQPAQATELWLAIIGTLDPNRRLIVAGDFNSSPVDVSPVGVVTAYQQLTGGMLINGTPMPFALTDTWSLRPGNPDGFTCCELGDLSNAPSQHGERIDLVLAYPAPARVKANVLDAEVSDKTASGHWPSDHASVSASLTY